MKTLVTGGSGYLGNHIRRYFNADDLSRSSGYDILDDSDASMAKDFDVVIHLASCIEDELSDEDQVFHTNVDGTVNILRNMRPDSVFIFASTKDVYGRFADGFAEVSESCPTLFSGQNSFAWSKLIAERYVEFFSQTKGFRACVFRLSTIYAPLGPGIEPNFVGHCVDAINKGDKIALPGGGEPTRDLLHVDDLSKACEAFIGSVIRFGLYNLGGGSKNAVTLKALINKMEDASGLQAVLDNDPLPDPIPRNYVTDIRLVGQELGWSPSITIDEGLRTLF